jgi:hypothetical protein
VPPKGVEPSSREATPSQDAAFTISPRRHLVRMKGLEPIPPFGDSHLKAARLPFRHISTRSLLSCWWPRSDLNRDACYSEDV